MDHKNTEIIEIGVPEDNLCLQQIGGGICENEGLIREEK